MPTYVVQVQGQKKKDRVVAGYFRIQDGNLNFRNPAEYDSGYPIFVKSYAAGKWVSVEKEDD